MTIMIHKRLKEARTEQGLTQAELGDACGLHLSHISQIEKQHRLPSVPTLVTIATALGVSTDYLLGLTDA